MPKKRSGRRAYSSATSSSGTTYLKAVEDASERVASLTRSLGEQPKPANEGGLKTGQRI